MKKTFVFVLIIGVSFFAFSSQNAKKVAIVKVVRGEASMLAPDGEQKAIEKGDWLKVGTIVKTGARSFVRLSFIDKSSMNIGPKSELKIEKFSRNEAGVINVLSGKIRAKVTKDYLKMDKNKSKLFVKSRNAVMGVRGTDFLFSANAKAGTSTTILFEGSVVFNKIQKGDNIRNLESIVNKGRRIKPGEVSVANRTRKKPTVAAKMSAKQFKSLKANKSFKVADVKSVKKYKSVVPPGLNGSIIEGSDNSLKDEIKKIVKVNVDKKRESDEKPDAVNIEDTKGFIKGDDIRPADGILVHIDSGMIIPPGADSTFDKNIGEWVSSTNGRISDSGDYIPPAGFKINDDGQFLKVDIETGDIKGVVIIDIKPVDQMLPIESSKIIQYIPPKESIQQGPAPAGGSVDIIFDEFSKTQEEIMVEEATFEQKEKEEILERSPDGKVVSPVEDDGYLPPPPKAIGDSTINQPINFAPVAPPPPSSGSTRALIKVKRSN